MKDRLSSSLRILRLARRRDQLSPALGRLRAAYGVSHMTFLVVSSRVRPGRYPSYCTTYPAAWIDAYLGGDYFSIDPVIDVLRWGHLPVDWSSLDWRSPGAARLLREASRWDIGPHGLTLPVRGPEGERCLFSVATSGPRGRWLKLRADAIHEFIILSHYLHETVLALTGLRDSDGHQALSRRERECLELLASGRISKQIAAALGISESAVKQYLRSARLKLRATTSHQAVAKASFYEVISL